MSTRTTNRGSVHGAPPSFAFRHCFATSIKAFNPIDGTLMTIYNLSPSKNGQVSTLDTSSPTRKRTYDSYGVQFNARLPHGATLLGGFGFDRLLRNTCDEPDDPNQLRFCDDAETPELCRAVLNGEAKTSDEIKRRIKTWKADTLRA